MNDYCGPCKDEGRGVVIAHYSGVSAGKSPTGKAIPAKCWHHRFGKPLPAISAATVNAADPDDARERECGPTSEGNLGGGLEYSGSVKGTPPPLPKETTMSKHCACGCGEELNPGSPWFYKRGHKPKKNTKGDKVRSRPKATHRHRPAAKGAGIATICVTEANLDNFWAKLSLEEKAEIYQRQLEHA